MTLRIFPVLAGATYPVKRSPRWSTNLQTSVSGKRTSLARYSYPIYSIEIPYSVLRTAAGFLEYQDLASFFNLAQGSANVFRWNDPDSNAAVAQLIGVGDGVTTQFQLLTSMTGLNFAWNDPVFFPTGSPLIYKAGVLQGSGYSISTNGLVTFATPPAAGNKISWTGTYDWLVRFDDDSNTFEKFNYNMWELKAIKFSTEKI